MIKQKNTSIKKRVTLYYSFILILMTALVLGLLLYTANRQIDIVTKDTIMKAVQNSFDEIEYANNIIEIDNDFDAFHRGVTLLVYTEGGELIKGSIPSDFPVSTPLTNGEYQEIQGEESTWLIYDLYNTYENGQSIWVRGIYDMDNAVLTISGITRGVSIFLPLFLILAILAGRRITQRAFEPVSSITQAADSINSGHDLSKRLPQGENKDELYDLTQTLNQMIARLEDAFIAEKEFSSDVSHELKTPISVILAECEYTLQQPRDTAEYVESLETIQKQSKRTLSLIQQLLQVSRTIDKEKSIEREDFDLSILCEGIGEELSLVAAEKGVSLGCQIQENIQIHGDETLIMRMILNLLTNAIKYSASCQNPQVFLTLSKDQNIKISVCDNGIGIKEEDQASIFNRFYKVDKSRSGDENSFGLGLAMVKWIAEAHGGEVHVQSTFGEGSTFVVTLPASPQ